MELKEVKELLDNQEPVVGDDYFSWYDDPIFPFPGRKDLCVARREVALVGGSYDEVFLVWEETNGLKYKEIANSAKSRDSIHICKVEVQGEKSVKVKLESGGDIGVPWSYSIIVDMESGQISKLPPSTFEEEAKEKMLEVVENHQHYHPLYKPTVVTEFVILEPVAVCILKEEMDTILMEGACCWLHENLQFMVYSLWVVKNGEKVKLYEDHGYIQSYTETELIRNRGYVPELKDIKVEEEGKVIKVTHKVTHLKGEMEEQESELTFHL
jgi:hypothetical protein